MSPHHIRCFRNCLAQMTGNAADCVCHLRDADLAEAEGDARYDRLHSHPIPTHEGV